MVERVVTAEELSKFLEKVRKGEGLHKAARALGVPFRAVQAARDAYPEFDAAVTAAEVEAAEPVETELYMAAQRGEPWAVTAWLKNRSPERWGDRSTVKHEVSITHEVGPRLERIAHLRAELERRRAALEAGGAPVLDVPSVEV